MPTRLDYESFSHTDIRTSGAARYFEDPATEILCLAYKFDNQPTQIWTPLMGPIPHAVPELVYRARNGDTFHAWNAGFELSATNTHAGQAIGMPTLHISQMRDSAARAAGLALPRKMESCAKALLKANPGMTLKDEVGADVMKKVSKPRKPTRAEPYERYTRQNRPDLFATLDRYCITDVDTETSIDEFLGPLDPYEQAVWELDYVINNRGVPVDRKMVQNIVRMRDEYFHRLNEECKALCGVYPSQVKEILGWMQSVYFAIPFTDDFGVVTVKKLDTLTKDVVALALAKIREGTARAVTGWLGVVNRVLEIRQQTSQTSTGKFDAILRSVNADDKIRGMFLYHGAGPGRWAGRIVQLQNLKKPVIGQGLSKGFKKRWHEEHGEEYDMAVDLANVVGALTLRGLTMLYSKPIDALSSIIRPAIQAPEGQEIIVADFNSVEARILSWLANEEWRMQVFRTHGKIYEATASQLSGIPLEEIGKDSKERQSGKVAELALGYQGSVGALIKMGAIERYGLKYHELKPLVKAWRGVNPRIVAMWYDIENAVLTSMKTGQVVSAYRCNFGKEGMFFKIQLPSGRKIAYAYPRVEERVRVWNDDKNRFENFDPRRHPTTPHERTRFDEELETFVTYMHEGFRPQRMEQFFFEGEDSTSKQWVTQDSYGGKFTENIDQGIAACLLRNGLFNTERAGYANILHVHDEAGALVRAGTGDVKRYEDLLCDTSALPWAAGLPLKAAGYRAKRYTKD